MIHVFKKRYPNARISTSSGTDVLVTMKFDDATNMAEADDAGRIA